MSYRLVYTQRAIKDIQKLAHSTKQAMEILLRLSEQYPGRIQAADGPFADARMWTAMEAARSENAPISKCVKVINVPYVVSCGTAFGES
ncbi:MAG: hypothetical protein WCA08_26050 [Desulfoferrobacter sp.]